MTRQYGELLIMLSKLEMDFERTFNFGNRTAGKRLIMGLREIRLKTMEFSKEVKAVDFEIRKKARLEFEESQKLRRELDILA